VPKHSKYGRVDSNQKQVVQNLRKYGYSVLILSNVGKGCPDLLVGANGVNVLVELKDSAKPPSQKKLTPDEIEFFDTWKGAAIVAESADEIMQKMKLWTGK